MSSVNEVMGSTGVVNYFDPSKEQSKARLAAGIYPAHIVKCDRATRSVRNKYKADIYNFRIKIDNSVSSKTYQIEGIDGNMKEVSGSNYVGREVRSSGIFFFITPDVGDDFEANPGGNRKYMDTVIALGVDCPDVEVDIDGEKKMVKSLP